jgi:hypothetical protein
VPLPSPILDDRSWDQLRGELVERIPVYTPEWTDLQASDPGITLLELFAFLGENLLYRFNQIPEATRLEFLRLLDLPLRPAEPAEALVSFAIDAGTELIEQHDREVRAGAVPFEVQTETCVLPVTIAAFARMNAGEPEQGEERDYADLAIDAYDLAADERPRYYRAQPLPEDPGAPTTEPLDFDASVDGILWLAVVKGRGTDVRDLHGRVLNVGVVPADAAPPMAEVDPCPGRDRPPAGPAIVWEASVAKLPGDDDRRPRYRPLRPAGDTTAGFQQPGVVRLELPEEADFNLGDPAPDDVDLAGAGDLPPAIDDEELAANVLFWLRAYRRDGESVGELLWAGANAAAVRQQRRAGPEYLGTGTGEPDQRMALINPNVVAGSLSVEVEERGIWKPWQEVDSFAGSGPDDREYVLDPEAGVVRFGAMEGRPPQIGERVRTSEYRYGGGAAGNVDPKAIEKIDRRGATIKVQNPLPATGGADAESVSDALERIPGELRRRSRAVTSDDFRELALAVPGAPVARAECLPRFHPHHSDQFEAPGVVSVVVWPREDRRHPNAPRPGRALLRRVCRALDACRLVTTELYVIPPTYRRVAVAVGLQVAPGFGVEAVRAWVELVVRQYLAPVRPYGPTGGGWPLGRRVHGPELEAAALQVEGVEFLNGLRVAGRDPADTRWVEGTVALRRYEVPELAEITVVEGDPLAPGAAIEPPAPPPSAPGEAPAPGSGGPPDGGGPGGPGEVEPVRGVPIQIPRLRREC